MSCHVDATSKSFSMSCHVDAASKCFCICICSVLFSRWILAKHDRRGYQKGHPSRKPTTPSTSISHTYTHIPGEPKPWKFAGYVWQHENNTSGFLHKPRCFFFKPVLKPYLTHTVLTPYFTRTNPVFYWFGKPRVSARNLGFFHWPYFFCGFWFLGYMCVCP